MFVKSSFHPGEKDKDVYFMFFKRNKKQRKRKKKGNGNSFSTNDRIQTISFFFSFFSQFFLNNENRSGSLFLSDF